MMSVLLLDASWSLSRTFLLDKITTRTGHDGARWERTRQLPGEDEAAQVGEDKAAAQTG